MEISSTYDFVLIGKYDRIICHCVYFSGYHLISISHGVSGGAVYLRRASQRIRVLYLMLLQRQSVAGSFQKRQQILRRLFLAQMSSQVVYLMVVGLFYGVKGLSCHGAGQISYLLQGHGVPQDIDSHCRHHLSAVVESQPLLGRQNHRSYPRLFHSLRGGDHLSLIFGFTFSYESQCYMGQRSQIAGSAQGTFLRDYRVNASVEHIYKSLKSR